MSKKFTLFYFLLFTFLGSAYAMHTLVPFANSAWVHDLTVDQKGNVTGAHPGQFLAILQAYNQGATPGHQIGMLFTYVGHIQITPNNVVLNYFPVDSTVTNAANNWLPGSNNGMQSVQAYSKLTLNGQGNGQPILNFVDIVAALDSTSLADLTGIHQMNTFSKKLALHFADNVAKKLCANAMIDGVQFDIEPFTFKGSNKSGLGRGQQYFYTEIAKDLAGYHHSGNIDAFNCRNANHPQGRYLSVVASVSEVQGEGQQIAAVMNKYGNGFVVVAIHGVIHLHNGVAVNPAILHANAEKQAAILVKAADKFQIPYQIVIPASGIENMFECNKSPKDGCQYSGYDQIDYVKATMTAISDSGARNDPLFKGVAVYAFFQGSFIHQNVLLPSNPTLDKKQQLIAYLQKNL